MLWDWGAGRVILYGRATMGSSRSRFRHLYSVSQETQKPIYVSSPFENKPHAINHGMLLKEMAHNKLIPLKLQNFLKKKGWQNVLYHSPFFCVPSPSAWPSAEAGARQSWADPSCPLSSFEICLIRPYTRIQFFLWVTHWVVKNGWVNP